MIKHKMLYPFVFIVIIGILVGCYFLFDESETRIKIVEITDGSIRGLRETSLRKQVDFYAFRGIPFAKPPLGELRFKAPVPAEPWKPNVLDAFKHSNMCIQWVDPTSTPNPQHEDCLYLNVYVPADIEENEKLPVMTYIYGGAYTVGSAHDIPGPDFLIENRVILVAMNYRLGVLGFLSLGLPEYSGNMGLKDQQLAIKWVHQNIEHFGGDINRITLFGQSAGGSSTHFHILSPESRKYFNRAIIMSGSALNYWALSAVDNHVYSAYNMANIWRQSQSNLTNLIEWLKIFPAQKFLEFSRPNFGDAGIHKFPFVPIVEHRDAVRPFIVDWPEETYKNSSIHMDVLFGITSQEYLGFSKYMIKPEFRERFNLKLPFHVKNSTISSEEYKQIISNVREFYFGDAEIDDKLIEQYVTLFSDMNFAYHIYKSASIHAQQSNANVFFYHFSVNSKLNIWKRMTGLGDKPGAGHCDDLCYVFRCGFAQKYYDEVFGDINDEQSQVSLQVIDQMTKMFTSFAKYGAPVYGNESLPAFNSDKMKMLDINNQGRKVMNNYRNDMLEFWAYIEDQVRDISEI